MLHIQDWTIKQNASQNDYTGEIVDIKDPKCKNRARVRIAGIHDGVPDNLLPFFRNGNITSNTQGSHEVKLPVLHSKVKVVFENTCLYSGVFYESLKSTNDNDSEFLEDYGSFDGHKDQWGNTVKTYANGNFLYISNKGVTVKIEGTTCTVSGLTQTDIYSEKTIHHGDLTIIGNTVHQGNIDTTGNVTTTGNMTTNGNTTTNGDNTVTGKNMIAGKNIDPSHTHSNGNMGANTGGVN